MGRERERADIYKIKINLEEKENYENEYLLISFCSKLI